jgi:hypothetical protein
MEKREKTKGVIRSRNSKYRQYNGKERKDKKVMRSRNSKYRQYNGKERKDQRGNQKP